MSIKYITLNGPPYSGKTTMAREIARMLVAKHVVISDSFAAPMRHFIATMLGERYDHLRKDSPRAELTGYSPREFLIELSTHLKTVYGDDCFGRWLVHRSLRYTPPPRYVVVDDVGFAEELDAVPNHVLVHIERPGTSFARDSRSYLPNPHIVLSNDGTLDEMYISCRTLVSSIEEGKI